MMVRRATVSDAKGIAKVLVDVRKEVNHGLVPETYLDNLTYDDREKRWLINLTAPVGREDTWVAVDKAGTVVGFAHGGPVTDISSAFDSELYEIYIAKSARGVGVGRALLFGLADSLIKLKFTSLEVWVLAGNPYRKFYEALGAEFLGNRIREIGGAECAMALYGWKHLEKVNP
jgi:ribosomal protein S18 acetylase RimI-like enzyme